MAAALGRNRGAGLSTKYLQAYIVLPALVLTFFFLGPGTWGRRFVQLLAAAGALIVSSGWWLTMVELVPASSRSPAATPR